MYTTEMGGTNRRRVPAWLWVVALASACGGGAPAPPEAVTPAADSGASRIQGSYGVYVTNETSGDLTVIDPATNTVVATVPLGKRPRGIRVSPDLARLYVALSGSPIAPPGVDEDTLPPADKSADGIGVVDVKTLALVTVLKGGSDPEQTSLSLDGTKLYVANEDTGEATVIAIASGETLARLPVGGEPEGVTTSPDGRFVYVTAEEDNQVSVIDTARDQVVARIAVGARPRDTAFLPDSSRAYVTAENGGTVSVIDTATHKVIETIALTGENVRPMGIVAAPDGTRLYVSTGRGASIVVIDTATLKPVGSVQVGQRPWGLALSPDGTRLYTANGPSNDVSVVDTQTMTVVGTIAAGARPWGVVVVGK